MKCKASSWCPDFEINTKNMEPCGTDTVVLNNGFQNPLQRVSCNHMTLPSDHVVRGDSVCWFLYVFGPTSVGVQQNRHQCSRDLESRPSSEVRTAEWLSTTSPWGVADLNFPPFQNLAGQMSPNNWAHTCSDTRFIQSQSISYTHTHTLRYIGVARNHRAKAGSKAPTSSEDQFWDVHQNFDPKAHFTKNWATVKPCRTQKFINSDGQSRSCPPYSPVNRLSKCLCRVPRSLWRSHWGSGTLRPSPTCPRCGCSGPFRHFGTRADALNIASMGNMKILKNPEKPSHFMENLPCLYGGL